MKFRFWSFHLCAAAALAVVADDDGGDGVADWIEWKEKQLSKSNMKCSIRCESNDRASDCQANRSVLCTIFDAEKLICFRSTYNVCYHFDEDN